MRVPAACEIVTASAGATISTAQSVFRGGGSLALDGVSGYVSVPDLMQLRPYADWTIEAWVYPTRNTNSAVEVVVGKFVPSTLTWWSWLIAIDATGILRFYASSNLPKPVRDVAPHPGTALAPVVVPAWDIANGVSIGHVASSQWSHVAVTRAGNSWKTFLNGALISTFTSALVPYADRAPIVVGAAVPSPTPQYFAGYVDELRLSHTARYAGAFSPSASAFEWDEYTALLLHFDTQIPVFSDPDQLATRRIESIAVLDRILDALGGCFIGSTGRQAYPLRRAIGDLRGDAQTLIANKGVNPSLLACFQAALVAGAGIPQFQAILNAIDDESPVSGDAVAVVQAARRYCLAQMARRLAATTFASRTDADAALTQMRSAFEPSIEGALDQHDAGTYQALMMLQGAVTRDLAARSLLLPQRVAYSFESALPTLALAQRIYTDGARADEITAENRIVHPAFAPRQLVCLSS